MMHTLNIVLTVLVLTAIGYIGLEYPGDITVNWGPYEVRTSLFFAFVVLSLLVFISMLMFRLSLWLKNLPKRFKEDRREKRLEEGVKALVGSLEATASGKHQQAKMLAEKATQLLPNAESTSIIAETFYLEAPSEKTTRRYEKMAENPNTAFLGLRGLIQLARRRNDWSAVRVYAEQALNEKQDSPFALAAFFESALKTGKLDTALDLMSRIGKQGVFNTDKKEFYEACLCTEQAHRLLEAQNAAEAMESVKRGLKVIPNFAPLLLLKADILESLGKESKAIKELANAFEQCPRPEILNKWLSLSDNGSNSNKLKKEGLKLIEQTAKAVQKHYFEGLIYLYVSEFEEAYRVLNLAREDRADREVLESLARAQEALGQPEYEVGKTLKQALKAKPLVFAKHGFVEEYRAWRMKYLSPEPKTENLISYD